MTTPILWFSAVVLAVFTAGAYLVRRSSLARQGTDRLFTELEIPETAAGDPATSGWWLPRWLFLAGFRGPRAAEGFVVLAVGAAGLGLVLVYLLSRSGLMRVMVKNVASLPAGASDLFMPLVYLVPWLAFLLLAAMPWVIVRSARRRRVEQTEQDLPISLELLATLSESGLGFDAALAHLLESVNPERPLPREFATYQSNVLAGRTRIEALRRMARRLEVPSVTIFVSAIVQAEQIGSGISETLCHQADDLRDRRRERATAFAMALPVKRMFPLVICFLPGLFIWTLGPFFVQLLQMADTFLQVRKL